MVGVVGTALCVKARVELLLWLRQGRQLYLVERTLIFFREVDLFAERPIFGQKA